MQTITVPVRLRGVWKMRLLLWLLFWLCVVGVIRDEALALELLHRRGPRLVEFQVGNRGKWRRLA